MKFKKILVLLTFVLCLSLSICQAEERKDEWKSPSFNFGSVKTVVVTMAIAPEAKFDEFSSRKLENIYLNTFFQDRNRWAKSHFQFITLNQLKDRVSQATGENIRQLETEDPARYKSEIDKFTPIIADAVLNIKVTAFGYDKRFVPESSYTYTEQVESEADMEVLDSNGRWVHKKMKVRKPVERTVVTPAHYDTYANAGMEYILLDSKTNEAIWMLRDIREANGKDPMGMTERIMNRAADYMLKL
ncbi:MAG: hypothetical protein E6713_00495 [Sporomusaceae bacterium]|nr:hypothetical protein [Sporomusaceae bacterium]